LGAAEARAVVVELSDFERPFCGHHSQAVYREIGVRADLAEAERLSLTATSAFLIGEATSAGAVRVTRRVDGAHPMPIFQAAIEGVLAGPGSDAK